MNIGNNRRVCDAEIGSPKRGWHSCGRKAVVESTRKMSSGYHWLDYCEQHKERAYKTDSAIVFVESVKELTNDRS